MRSAFAFALALLLPALVASALPAPTAVTGCPAGPSAADFAYDDDAGLDYSNLWEGLLPGTVGGPSPVSSAQATIRFRCNLPRTWDGGEFTVDAEYHPLGGLQGSSLQDTHCSSWRVSLAANPIEFRDFFTGQETPGNGVNCRITVGKCTPECFLQADQGYIFRVIATLDYQWEVADNPNLLGLSYETPPALFHAVALPNSAHLEGTDDPHGICWEFSPITGGC